MLHKVLTSDAQMKVQDAGSGSLTFYASTFSNWDRVRPIPERPTKGAFSTHLAAFITDGFISIAHDWDRLPVASIVDAREDDFGVLVTADFHSTPEAQQARVTTAERLNRGKSVKTSIGYEVLDDEYVPMDDVTLKAQGIETGRLLKDIYLYEVSIVNVPANPLADVTRVKALTPNPRIAPILVAVKSLYEAQTMADWEAAEILQVLLSYVAQGRLLSAADPAALTVTAALLREAQAVVTTLITTPPAEASLSDGKAAPLRRVPFAVDADQVQRALTTFVHRAKARQRAYSRKEGRVLSQANRTKLTDMRPQLRALLDIIDDLLTASEPKAAPDLTTEYLRFLALEAKLLGVPIR